MSNNPRRVALSVINDVLNNNAYANIALNEKIKSENLTELDKNLVTNLVYGTISKKLTLDWYTKPYVKKTKKWVKNLLAMTVYQIIYMDRIPTSAAVDEAVKIAKKQGDQRLSGFVNGVLRNFTRADFRSFDEISDSTEKLSIQYSMPIDLTKKFVKSFGFEKTVKIFRSIEEPSRASLRVNTTLTDVTTEFNKLAREFDVELSEISPTGIVAESGHFADLLDFNDGLITIQDESSQLVATVLDAQPTDRILDACAAPGGKTVHIAEYLSEAGYIEALDLYDHKLRLIRQNAERLHQSEKIRLTKLDARQSFEKFGPDSFDKILVDAPCSGLGLIRRKPDIRYRKETTDFADLQKVQLDILENTCKTLVNSGIMVYSTCTIFDEENYQVIETFLAKHPEFEQVPLTHEKSDLVKNGCLFITPDAYHTDGFFIAKLRKK
ncbi:16S rRNA (cytosine(967)-C(5))-methyltransferase RsmB [Pseudolactococcus paracarnosus]|uniref:16S rRNA (cytosine(967)-C(5))-methyltransferase n=1 Tax=Pseudolactococcus paracarnosus TaxID=2749962 RepID=A0A7L4WFT4_9LACT|nr:16S rRNA (cytosine(967)-C(5))-methyltransferase RsmB [Lactococcus paracarnosus]SPC37420.1 RNA-binding Sun protein; 16S rRNA m5C967 methyltransferase, S-adenosyl-L-methionine-dependent [Lactococcus piscium]MCJ1976790.1 16S rRNA (cytosine(967)-C(5))-methyltransferase RsmB [Lactococcus paracarnosus]MCJ1982824.1 16S rRNA (cytosine(967)-C(5))-methyltransferase RsmB [Lactococcus paracarnosus]MCJ1993437.1 16S rRNA (cytosine(967)-C(5))-methyltransferase RsmB [Lactococcus paracarnosus]MCJ1997445.1 1